MSVDGILVTGGAGFIGSACVRALMSRATDRVLNLDKLTYAGNLESLPGIVPGDRYEFVHADIGDEASVKDVLQRFRPRAIIHLAAESHVDRSIDGPKAFVETNVVGTFTLLTEALRYYRALDAADADRFRFLHVSTDEVFGSLGDSGVFTELTAYRPNSPYAATKASSDHLVRAWHHTYGLPTLVTNCSNNYGPYQFPEKLIPLMILNALAGAPLPVYGKGQNVRDWLFVEDHVEALLLVLERGRVGETYAVGGGAERTNMQVVRAICDVVDALVPDPRIPSRADLIRFVPDRPGHDLRYAIDASKLRSELGWRPRHTFESGLRATVEWYLTNDAWCQRVQTGVYRRERLGLAASPA